MTCHVPSPGEAVSQEQHPAADPGAPVPAGDGGGGLGCHGCVDGASAADVGQPADAAPEEDPLAQATDPDQGEDARGELDYSNIVTS